MGHPAQYSGKKQGDSTDNFYGSKLEKKALETQLKQTNKSYKICKTQILHLSMRHPEQYSGQKQGNSTDYISGSNSDKKESAQVNKQTVSVKSVNSKFTTFIGAPCTV